MDKIVVTKDNRQRVRAYYFSLCDQGKANFLYDNDISGGHLMLSPHDYPKSAPNTESGWCDRLDGLFAPTWWCADGERSE